MKLVITRNKENTNLIGRYKLIPIDSAVHERLDIDSDFYKVLNYDNNNLFGYYDSRFYNNNFAEYLNDCHGLSDIIEVIHIENI